jgi:integrase
MDAYRGHLRRIGKSPSTVDLYRNGRKRIPDLATLPLPELTAANLDDLYGSLAERGLKASTIRNTHAHIRAARSTRRVTWGWVAENPARNATLPANRQPNRVRLDPGDVLRMIVQAIQPKEHGGEGDIVLAMAIFLATYAGGRRGELCGLRWDGFDAEAGTLSFEQQWVPETGGQRLASLKSETGALDGKRTIALGAETIAVLKRFRGHQRATVEIEPAGW